MAITYPRALPADPQMAALTLEMIDVVGVARSAFTLEEQVQEHQGQAWRATITLPLMGTRAQAAPWIAWLASLKGRAKTFLAGDPKGAAPRGAAAATPGMPLVKGAGQAGDSLAIDGAPINTTGYLLEGDYIQLGGGSATRLHVVLEDADSDGVGNVTLTIWPNLRGSPADDAPLTLTDCKAVFRLTANSRKIDIQPDRWTVTRIVAQEVV